MAKAGQRLCRESLRMSASHVEGLAAGPGHENVTAVPSFQGWRSGVPEGEAESPASRVRARSGSGVETPWMPAGLAESRGRGQLRRRRMLTGPGLRQTCRSGCRLG